MPVITALIADAAFGYFPAIRQIIFVLAPLALLFTVGVEALFARWPKAALALAAALLIAGVVGNVNFFRRPREDWRAAAAVIANEPCVDVFADRFGSVLFVLCPGTRAPRVRRERRRAWR